MPTVAMENMCITHSYNPDIVTALLFI